GLAVPDPQAFTTFAEFQRIFGPAFAVVQARPGNLCRTVREIVEDAAADGAVWVQPHFNPIVYAVTGSPEHVLEAVIEAGRDEGSRLGVGFGLTMAVQRHQGPEAAVSLARMAARYADHGVYALGLTGDELSFPAEPFAEAFAIARDAGLTAAPHAGELAGPESVRAAVEVLGATRIAHGITAARDPRLMDLLAERGVGLDVCLTSNRRLGVVTDLREHSLTTLLDAGIRCTLGTDDPLMFGASLVDEYEIARDVLGLDDERLAAIARSSVDAAHL
ncbi:MAG TPA: adenosine deaminase, partial [Micromonosporaceae bacterium]